jgi:asparagine synthase (glutamine-hydrolysing)
MTLGPWTLGHTRLAIVDLDIGAAQPMRRGAVLLAFNGELWNNSRLRESMPTVSFSTRSSDTETLAWVLATTPDSVDALRKLSGMFAIVWTDGTTLKMARDPYGEIPLHYGHDDLGNLVWASELKALLNIGAIPSSIDWVRPGSVYSFTADGTLTVEQYSREIETNMTGTPGDLERFLAQACSERAISDVPVGCLMSGGIDSTVIAYHLRDSIPDLIAYTAVFDRSSRDLKCARVAASELGVTLVEVDVPSPTADDLADVVRRIEMPHKAQVEIAWPCLKIAERMNADGIKVVLSGEGSDELWASYGRDGMLVKQNGWDAHRRKSFFGQHRKNFARCNKVFMQYGVECRLPFLHDPLVRFALSLDQPSVEFAPSWNPNGSKRSKAILSAAYDGKIPDEITRRPKVAFQTGAGLDAAAATAVANPIRFYRAEYSTRFRGVKP